MTVVFIQTGWAAEMKSATESAYTPGAAYHKKIPGSSHKIQGSRPQSYIKPKKVTYQEHMASLSQHRFKNESSSFGHRTGSPDAIHKQRVLTSSRPPSSRIQVHPYVGQPAAGISRNQPLSEGDFVFLGKMSETVRAKDPAVASRLDQIAAGQKQNRLLSKDEYEFLMGISKYIDDGQASYRLHSIAEKRRETLYQ